VIFIPLTVVRVKVVSKEPFLEWWSNYIRNPTTHPSSLWSPDLAPCDFWAFPTMKREL
jgi:hypothetical protein